MGLPSIQKRACCVAVIALVVSALGACGTDAPLPASAYGGVVLDSPSARLAAMNTLDARVNAVGFRLSAANAELCPKTGPITGMLLHSETQYADYLRPSARADWNLDGNLPGVAAIAPGSPAEAAGLKVGDILLSVDGENFAAGNSPDASFEGQAANLDLLEAALSDGSISLLVRRSGDVETVHLRAVTGCAYPFQLDPSDDFYARADGKRVFVSSAMAALSPLDDDLAVVLGHELAHNVLDHRAFFDEVGLARDLLGNWGVAPWDLVKAERDADRVGLYLLARAGYDPRRAAPFWRMLSARLPHLKMAQWGHPSAGERISAVELIADEISEQQASGRPLIP